MKYIAYTFKSDREVQSKACDTRAEAAKGAGRHCRRGAGLSTKTENETGAEARETKEESRCDRARLICFAAPAARQWAFTGLDLTLWASILSGTSDTRSHSFKPTH